MVQRLSGIKILRHKLAYAEDASRLFAELGGTSRPHTALLESADVSTKSGLHSIAIVGAALRVQCSDTRVTVTAYTTYGEALIEHLSRESQAAIVSRETLDGGEATARLVLEYPDTTATTETERLTALSSMEALRMLSAGATVPGEDNLPLLMGGWAFDYLASFEELPTVPDGPNTFPDYHFIVGQIILNIDHQAGTAELIGLATTEEEEHIRATLSELAGLQGGHEDVDKQQGRGPFKVRATVSDADFRADVQALQQNIYQGDIYQVVPARSFVAPCADAYAAYQQLRATNPSPYMFYVRDTVGEGDEIFELFGASPESNLKFNPEDRMVQLYPIAGTRPRGLNPDGSINAELDIRNELDMRTDPKELAEHTMLVDLARNDLARVGVAGTRKVADLLQVDRYSRVMHLVSRVTAELKPELDALDAYRACMNMGTLTGAPKIRATELLRETEGQRRGSYGGAVGYIRGDGAMDTCIVIRSAYVQSGTAIVQAGAGVVRDSNPQSEADETVHKAFAVLKALALAAGHQEQDIEVER